METQKNREIKLSYPHPEIDFYKCWLHLHRQGTPIYMDAYFKTWGFKNLYGYLKPYQLKGDFEDLYLFFKEGNWYGKYNIKFLGYVMLDYLLQSGNLQDYLTRKNSLKNDIEIFWNKYSKEEVDKLTLLELIQIINECHNFLIKSFVVDPFAPMIGEMAVDYTNWWLDKKELKGDDRKKAFYLLFSSGEVSETIKRQLDVQNSIDNSGSGVECTKVIKYLLKKYAYAKSEFGGYLPYTIEDILREYDEAQNLQIAKNEINEKEELLKSLGATQQEKEIFHLFGYSQYSRDERKDYLQRIFTVADWTLERISNILNVPIHYLRCILIGEVSLNNLENKEFLEKLKLRYERGICMYFSDCGQGNYVEGEKGEILYNSIDNKESMDKVIKGQPTFYGKVKGKVKIITDPKMAVPEEPFILVTGMTSPDFIHFMQKCTGIITDEGGITSHAAILSRELKKPCIVGAKIARKILKDGDLIELDADEGVVRIL